MKTDYTFRQTLRLMPVYAVLIIASIIALGPVLWVLMNSLKTLLEIEAQPLALPRTPQWSNYVQAWTDGGLGHYFVNTFIVAAVTIVIVVVAASLAGYAFARLHFAGSHVLFFLFFFGMTIPVPILLAPLLSLMLSLKLVNSLTALILVYAGTHMPFAILLTRSFFRQFPQEVEDAARVDGCSSLDVLRRVILPLSLPAIAVLVVFDFMSIWGEFFIALMLINSDSAKTISLGLVAFQGENVTQYNLEFAGIVLAALPVLLIYVLFQRTFIQGITAGSLK